MYDLLQITICDQSIYGCTHTPKSVHTASWHLAKQTGKHDEYIALWQGYAHFAITLVSAVSKVLSIIYCFHMVEETVPTEHSWNLIA